MIQYIASDLDGTLLQDGAQELNPEIFDLILRLREKGILFIAASGRQYYNIRNLFSPVKDKISYIAENGSLCIHNHEVISRGLIERNLGLRILAAAKEYSDCDCILSCESRCYTDSTNQEFIDHMNHIVKYDMEVVSDLRAINEPFLKIAMCDFHGTDKMRKFFQSRFSSEIKAVTSGNIWVDFIAPNANKGTALSNLLGHLNLAPENGIVFGDQYNDIEMLKLAGTSYAMSGAAPGVSSYADYVTDSVENVLSDLVASL